MTYKCKGEGGKMLIFQLHLPHVIPNGMQALRALSHSEITFRKAPSQYQHVSLKLGQMTKLLSQKLNCHLIPWFVESKTLECCYWWPICCIQYICCCYSSSCSCGAWSPSDRMSFEYASIIPASVKQVLSHLAIVLLETGSCFPIHDKNNNYLLFALNSFVLASYACSVVTGQIIWSSDKRNLPGALMLCSA